MCACGQLIICSVLMLGTSAQQSWWWQTPTLQNLYYDEGTTTPRIFTTNRWWERAVTSSQFRVPIPYVTTTQKPPCICTFPGFCAQFNGQLDVDTNWPCDRQFHYNLICCRTLKSAVPQAKPPPSKRTPEIGKPTSNKIEPYQLASEYDEDENDVDQPLNPNTPSPKKTVGLPEPNDTPQKSGGEISVDELNEEGLPPAPSNVPPCGVAAPSLEWKNQYSLDASFGEFPWTLLLLLKLDNLDIPLVHCGAALIDPKVAVTAAHCVSRKNLSIIVRAGEWDTSNTDENYPHQDRKIKDIIPHPEYNEEHLTNDIALLILDEPFKLQNNIKKLCIPVNETFSSTCIATGWGGRGPQVSPQQQTIMKKAVLNYVPSSECQRKLQNTPLGEDFRLYPKTMCAAAKGEDTCVGDGGGPLFCQTTTKPRKYILVGITSWGKCKDPNAPGVYTKVTAYKDWIVDNLAALYQF